MCTVNCRRAGSIARELFVTPNIPLIDEVRVQYENHTEFVDRRVAERLARAANARPIRRKKDGLLMRVFLIEHGNDHGQNSRHLDSRKTTFVEQLDAGKIVMHKRLAK